MDSILRQYHTYLRLERGFSANTVEAYERDLRRLLEYFAAHDIDPVHASMEDLQAYIYDTYQSTTNTRTQARQMSGVKSFYRFLLYHDIIDQDPSELIEMPKKTVHLPDVLTVEEIDAMEAQIDLSKSEGTRNRAIIEMLYGSGLRVSELVTLKLSHMYRQEGYMLIEGKGSKQRLVPISPEAEKWFAYWLEDRNHLPIQHGSEDFAFLNRRGKPLTRVMVFYIIKDLAERAGIHKTISPHTLRHSFATHMLQNGADLSIIRQLLGHESIATTEIYTHVDVSDLRNAILTYHPANKR